MIVSKDDFNKLKHPETFMYKVYSCGSKNHYMGTALIAAESADEANQIIQVFKNSDPNNKADSWGYETVTESDHYDQFADEKGILESTIRYWG